MSISNSVERIFKLLRNPLRTALFVEILENKDITAKELIEKLYLKGTRIYFHLNKLEEEKIIVSTKHIIHRTNVFESTYQVNKEFYKGSFEDILDEGNKSLDKLKDRILFQLYLGNFLVNNQIRKIQSMTTTEFKECYPQKTTVFPQVFYVSDEDFPQFKTKFDELERLIDKSKKEVKNLVQKEIFQHSLILGGFSLRE